MSRTISFYKHSNWAEVRRKKNKKALRQRRRGKSKHHFQDPKKPPVTHNTQLDPQYET